MQKLLYMKMEAKGVSSSLGPGSIDILDVPEKPCFNFALFRAEYIKAIICPLPKS